MTWDWVQVTHWHDAQICQQAHAEAGSGVAPREHQHLLEERADGYLHCLGCDHVSMRFLYSEPYADLPGKVDAL